MSTHQPIRLERVQRPFIELPLRRSDGIIEMIELWREDRLDPDPDGDSVYLILDFAEPWKLRPGTDGDYMVTGGVVIEMQSIHRTTGEGLANPVTRVIEPSVPTIDDADDGPLSATGGREYSTRPLVGYVHLPVSPRRHDD